MNLYNNKTGRDAKNIYIKSFGCSSNLADGEVIAGCLKNAGYSIVSKPDTADLLIYNTCAVKSPTENRMMNILKQVSPEKKLIVTGCLPIINFKRLKKEVNFQGAIGPSPGSAIVEVVKKVERGDKALSLKCNFKPELSLPRVTVSPIVRIIPISYGCTGTCSYCSVRFARGNLRSYGVEEITQNIVAAIKNGVLEAWLTGQDISCYGCDISTDLTTLVNSIITIKYSILIRLGMLNPAGVYKLLPQFADVYKNKKIFKFLHVPVQSGDDEVLKDMRRNYSITDFKKLVSTFRKVIPKLTLATDIICGFPTEDEEAFNRTLWLIDDIKPDIVNVSKFTPRPKTSAARMKQLPSSEIKARSERLTLLVHKISHEKNIRWVSWKGWILIDEKGYGNSWVGRNFAYKPVVVKNNRNLMGAKLEVLVTEAFPTYLKADILNNL
jgi:threonylcarbamoyladenosine tRNA methylthiotransferase CDKAL1